MIPRFVAVPAIPAETEPAHAGGRCYCKSAPSGFNIYDNQDKQRLKPTYPTRLEAEAECARLNSWRLPSI